MKNRINLNPSWLELLEDEFEKPYMQELFEFLSIEKKLGKNILPQEELWFSALNATPLEEVKVVIVGQDPYPTLGHAHGLCFSAMESVKPLPKSLVNINKELFNDLGIDNSHTAYLQPWAEQGVLLLNSVFTVEETKANSHQGKGWEEFSDKIIEIINEKSNNVVFILWGAYAQKKGKYIDARRHLVLKDPHPSPLSAYRGFWGSKPFSKVNNYLLAHKKNKIDWKL